MARVFSGIQPSGEMTLGAYLGALRRFARNQDQDTSYFCIVDLHALTLPQDPAELRERIVRQVALYLAVGIDPERSTIFVQSHVSEHAEMAWLMECTAAFGELSRMTQFKDKSARGEFVSASLFTYPALMAGDILLYDTDEVPVGDDQRQHIELTRDVAIRFNARYGETFVVPTGVIPKVGARIMDLQTPTNKMSKSVDSPQGTVLMLDDAKDIEKKFKRAVTDNDAEVRFDRETKPGVSNLLEILAVSIGEDPAQLADKYTQYGPLKADAAAAVIELLTPVQQRFAELLDDRTELQRILADGAAKARSYASVTLAKAQTAVGIR